MAQKNVPCIKVKNHCNICLQKVNNKNGLQCQGACKRWVHFKCLNYTPGKIRDVKQGIIKINCPCPDCVTDSPKEVRTDEETNCSNARCPGNIPPLCNNHTCPSNLKHLPAKDKCTVPLESCDEKLCKIHRSTANMKADYSPSSSRKSSNACLPPTLVGDQRREKSPDFSAIDRMCTAVGQLTDQIHGLMSEVQKCVLITQGSEKQGSYHQKEKPKCVNSCQQS